MCAANLWNNYVQVLNLESKCTDLQVNITALREEISERESVIAQNYTTIQLLRRRLADMEKHRFVLGYRTQVTWSGSTQCTYAGCSFCVLTQCFPVTNLVTECQTIETDTLHICRLFCMTQT